MDTAYQSARNEILADRRAKIAKAISQILEDLAMIANLDAPDAEHANSVMDAFEFWARNGGDLLDCWRSTTAVIMAVRPRAKRLVEDRADEIEREWMEAERAPYVGGERL